MKWLYGLRQAPELWYDYLHSWLRKLGFVQSSAIDSLYLLLSSDTTVTLVWEDDISIIGENNRIDTLLNEIVQFFIGNDLGSPKNLFWGQDLVSKRWNIFATVGVYSKGHKNGQYDDFEPDKTSTAYVSSFVSGYCRNEYWKHRKMDGTQFRSVLESLLYISSRTIPAFCTAVSMKAKF